VLVAGQNSPERPTDREAFVRDLERFRGELLAHCYRFVGSVDEAEDLVQETYLRAWRAYGTFEGRSSVRVWLYQIATNTCLNALKHGSRRVLPSGLGAPSDDPDAATPPLDKSVKLLQPIPHALLDPATVVGSRETLRLGLIASLQHLPASQRAVLILRDVLAFSAADAAAILSTSVTAVKSTLQRARGKIASVAPRLEEVPDPSDPEITKLLDRYIQAIETSDSSALAEVLRDDATLEATSTSTWFAGKAACLPFLVRYVLGEPGDWRLLPTFANGQPAAVDYRRQPDGSYLAYGLIVLEITPSGVAGITSFDSPDLVTRWGFPLSLDPS
jgi:RNA polymerase sigma-70 factor (ECF subfamily)